MDGQQAKCCWEYKEEDFKLVAGFGDRVLGDLPYWGNGEKVSKTGFV